MKSERIMIGLGIFAIAISVHATVLPSQPSVNPHSNPSPQSVRSFESEDPDTSAPRLTLDLLQQINVALTALQKVWSLQPELAHRPWVQPVAAISLQADPRMLWCDDPYYYALPIEPVTEALAREPKLVAAITASKLTPRQFVQGLSAAIKSAVMITPILPPGKFIPLDSSTVLPHNMAFWRDNGMLTPARELGLLLQYRPPAFIDPNSDGS